MESRGRRQNQGGGSFMRFMGLLLGAFVLYLFYYFYWYIAVIIAIVLVVIFAEVLLKFASRARTNRANVQWRDRTNMNVAMDQANNRRASGLSSSSTSFLSFKIPSLFPYLDFDSTIVSGFESCDCQLGVTNLFKIQLRDNQQKSYIPNQHPDKDHNYHFQVDVTGPVKVIPTIITTEFLKTGEAQFSFMIKKSGRYTISVKINNKKIPQPTGETWTLLFTSDAIYPALSYIQSISRVAQSSTTGVPVEVSSEAAIYIGDSLQIQIQTLDKFGNIITDNAKNEDENQDNWTIQVNGTTITDKIVLRERLGVYIIYLTSFGKNMNTTNLLGLGVIQIRYTDRLIGSDVNTYQYSAYWDDFNPPSTQANNNNNNHTLDHLFYGQTLSKGSWVINVGTLALVPSSMISAHCFSGPESTAKNEKVWISVTDSHIQVYVYSMFNLVSKMIYSSPLNLTSLECMLVPSRPGKWQMKMTNLTKVVKVMELVTFTCPEMPRFFHLLHSKLEQNYFSKNLYFSHKFEKKAGVLKANLLKLRAKLPLTPNHCDFKIDRADLLNSAMKQFRTFDLYGHGINQSIRWRRATWKFNFLNELGIDSGGLTREFFTLFLNEIFKPETKLFFRYSSTSGYIPVGCLTKSTEESRKTTYQFVGKVIAKIVWDSLVEGRKYQVGIKLSNTILKSMLGMAVDWHDLKYDCEQVYKNKVKWLVQNNVEDMGLVFTEALEGVTKEIDLKRDGSKIEVNDSNKMEYVELLGHARLRGRNAEAVGRAVDQIVNGFSTVIPMELIEHFGVNEIQWLISGTEEIDVADWRKNTKVPTSQGEKNGSRS